MSKLAKSSKGIGGGRHRYWAELAQMMGMVDTDRGIRFKRVKHPEVHVDLSFDRNSSGSTSSSRSTLATVDTSPHLSLISIWPIQIVTCIII